MNKIADGFKYFLSGFELIFKPGIRKFVIIPFLINMVLFIGFFFLFAHYVNVFNVWFSTLLPGWLQWLSIILWVFFIATFILIFIYTFVTIANLISSPFNSLLAERVEYELTGILLPDTSIPALFKDIPRVLKRQFNILIYYIPRACLLIIIFFIPVVHSLSAPLWFLFNSWFMAMTFIDYPTDNHRVPIDQVRKWLKNHAGLSFGFGSSVLLFSMVPFLNFFTIPAAVAGATKLWVEENRNFS